MSDWRSEKRLCHCGNSLPPKREGQRHCLASCRHVAKKRRKRSADETDRLTPIPSSGDTPLSEPFPGLGEGPTMVWPESLFQVWPTPGALQGDDYEDGYPKLPASRPETEASRPRLLWRDL
jgi:hypothetical protein